MQILPRTDLNLETARPPPVHANDTLEGAPARKNSPWLLVAVTLLVLATLISPAYANCTITGKIHPSYPAGARHYDTTNHVLQYCDGTNWIDFPVSGTTTGCPGAGGLDWDSSITDYKYYDGTACHKLACALQCSGASWSTAPQTYFTASGGAYGDTFGNSVAVYGTLEVVGDPYKTIGSNSGQGAAYIFDVSDPSSPVQLAEITAADGAANDQFGTTVAIYGNIALIGAIGKNSVQGAAYIFDISNPESPVQKAEITASDGAAGDNFSYSMALYGNMVLVGAYFHAVGSNSQQGAAYLYDISNPSSPVQKAEITDSGGAAYEQFGSGVSLYNDTALIGALGGGSSGQGSAYVFDISNPSSPVQKAEMTASDGVGGDGFGYSVSVYRNMALIGAPYRDADGADPNEGVAYVFDISNLSSPVEKSEIIASDGIQDDQFGNSVSLYANMAAVGAWYAFSAAYDGAAYVYDISNPSSPVEDAELSSTDCGGYCSGAYFGTSVSLYNNLLAIGSPWGGASSQGNAYVVYTTCSSYACLTNGACTSTYSEAVAGSLKYVSAASYFEYCDGTNWIPVGPCGTLGLPFYDQSGVNLGTLTTSNIVSIPQTSSCDHTVSISGTGSPEFRICSDSACSSVVQNWGTASQTISAGQYIQMELTSSASGNTTNSATLTVGSASHTWNVTTWLGYKRVFVSSATYAGNIGSVAAANTDCANLASAASLSGTWKAWLAVTTGTDDPATTFTQSTYPYKLVDGTTTVANNWTGLVSGTLVAGISKDESGVSVAASTHVWTNVSSSGTATASGSSSSGNCSAWTSNGGNPNKANYGLTGSTTSTWTASSNEVCSTSNRFYCFEQ